MEIKIDFYNDWINNIKEQMTQWGYAVDPTDDQQTLAINYFHILERQIEPIPRTVLISKELSCPPQYQSAFHTIRKKAEEGGDLVPHLSKQILNSNYQDQLLNDWGIHHLHLGNSIDHTGFIERTGPLLFARITESEFFAIAILNHGAWTDRSLLQIIYNNWPKSISQYLLKNMRLTQEATPDEHRKLRAAGVCVLTSLDDGTVCMPIGGGVTTAKTGVHSIMEHDHYAHLITHLENVTKQQAELLVETCKQQNIQLPPNLHFQLVLENSDFIAQEIHTGLLIKVGQLP